MSQKSNTQEPPSGSPAKPQDHEQQLQPLQVKPEIPVIAEPKNAPKSAPVLTTANNARVPEPSANYDADTVHVPSYSSNLLCLTHLMEKPQLVCKHQK